MNFPTTIIDSGLRTQDSGLRTQGRDSSLELLRIVAMLMIVGAHYAQHGGFNFSINEFSINRIWQQLLYMHGQFGNDLFVLISGYFLVSSTEIKLRRIFGLVLRVLFYLILMTCLLISFKMPHSRGDLLGNWWFVNVYIILYLIHPYLNVLLNTLSREKYKEMLIMLGIYWSLVPTLMKWFYIPGGLISFIYVYSLAGYFKLHAKDYGNKKFILYGFGFIFLNLCSLIVFDYIGLTIPLFGERATYLLGMMKPFTLLGALCMFLGFRKIPLHNNKFVNVIAAATLGVYLIHENRFTQKWMWSNVFHTNSFQNSPYFIPYSIGVVVIVFVACTIIEIVRAVIFKAVSRGKIS